MSHTQGMWVQDGAATDMEMFVGASEFLDSSGHAVFASTGAGLAAYTLASTLAGTFLANVSALLKRTGMYATPAGSQAQYGTSASVPGPTTVVHTSGPLAQQGIPPTLSASMSTLAGAVAEPLAKGMQINSIDVIYSVGAVDASTAQVGVTNTAFVDNVAPAVTNIIAAGDNGLVKTQRANPYVKNVAVSSPAMITTKDSKTIIAVNLTAGSGGTITFWGVVVKCSFNLN